MISLEEVNYGAQIIDTGEVELIKSNTITIGALILHYIMFRQ